MSYYINFATIAAEQQADPELTQLDKTCTFLKLQAVPIFQLQMLATIICDVSEFR